MPPLLLGVIIYERGHINVTTANTVCSVCVSPSEWPMMPTWPALFQSALPLHTLTKSSLKVTHARLCVCVCVDFTLLLLPWLLLSCTFMKRAHSLPNHTYFPNLFLKLPYNPQTNFCRNWCRIKRKRKKMNVCRLVWGRVCLCRWHVCIFVIESVQKLYFCVSVVCVFSACVFVGIRAASLCFIRPPGVQCSLAILKVRDDTVGEGSVITATSPSLHLCFHVFSSLSLLWLLVCGLY